jgi:ribosomal protein S18 acetylase RimI-like enzyme
MPDADQLKPRLAGPQDLPTVTGVNAAAYARYSDRMDYLPGPVQHDYSPEIDAGQVWLVGEPVVAVIVLVPGEDHLLIDDIAVHPDAQRHGIGRQLMAFAERQATASGLSLLKLYTHETMVENIAFYTRLGYHETDRHDDEGFHRVFMEKRLPAS